MKTEVLFTHFPTIPGQANGADMLRWLRNCDLSDTELARVDVADLNLACAEGLPGANRIDRFRCLRTLDEWAGKVQTWTQAAHREFFLANPAAYDHSEAVFRCVALVTVLQRHCGVRYNPAKIGISSDEPFELEDSFVHGAIDGPGGTCATLPVVYAAIGCRLGYPIRLVCTKQHVFARWESPKERFNIEGSGEGLNTFSDDHYRTWPKPITRDEEKAFGWLKTLSPRQEYALFVADRAYRHQDNGDWKQAVQTFAHAVALDSPYARYPNAILRAVHAWEESLKKRMPPLFPKIEILYVRGKCRWPALPWELEKKIGWFEEVEDLLNCPRHNAAYWEPLRRGRPPMNQLPAKIVVDRTRR